MNGAPKIFGIIVEWKAEAPLIMEGVPMTHDQAVKRMREIALQSNVIRVAVFHMVFTDGNETLLPKENEPL